MRRVNHEAPILVDASEPSGPLLDLMVGGQFKDQRGAFPFEVRLGNRILPLRIGVLQDFLLPDPHSFIRPVLRGLEVLISLAQLGLLRRPRLAGFCCTLPG